MDHIDKSITEQIKITFTIREVGVFLLLFFLNLKFMTITITQNRSLVIDIIVYALFIINFNYSNWTYKKFLPTIAIIGIYTVINFSEYKLNVLMPLLVIQCVSGITLRRYLLISMIIITGMLAYMFVSYGLGWNMAGYTYFIDRKIRMNFGFNHPNTAALYYFCFIINGLLLLNYSKYQKYAFVYLIVLMPLWVFVYKQTGSRSFLLSILVLYSSYFYYFVIHLVKKNNLLKWTKYLLYSALFWATSATIYFSLWKERYEYLNRLLSWRLTYYDRFFRDLTPIDFIFGSQAYKDHIIDSSYVHLLFEAGIIFFLFFCWFYLLSTLRMVKEKAWIPVCITFSIIAYGLMETLLLYSMLIGTNVIWVLLYFYYKKGDMKL